MKLIYQMMLLVSLSVMAIQCGGPTREDVDNAYNQGVEAGRQNEEDAHRRRVENEERQRSQERQDQLKNRGLKQLDSMQ